MRGTCRLTEKEKEKYIPIFTKMVNLLLAEKENELTYNLERLDLSPANVKNILNLLGWERYNFKKYGWEQHDVFKGHDEEDFSYSYLFFKHTDYKRTVILYYCGFTSAMNLTATMEREINMVHDSDLVVYPIVNRERMI